MATTRLFFIKKIILKVMKMEDYFWGGGIGTLILYFICDQENRC